VVRDFPKPGEHWISTASGAVLEILSADPGSPVAQVRDDTGRRREVTLRFLFGRCRSPREHRDTLVAGLRQCLAAVEKRADGGRG